jgi:hypothetical protein
VRDTGITAADSPIAQASSRCRPVMEELVLVGLMEKVLVEFEGAYAAQAAGQHSHNVGSQRQLWLPCWTGPCALLITDGALLEWLRRHHALTGNS